MPIETQSSMTNILKNMDGNSWINKAKIESPKGLENLKISSLKEEGMPTFGQVLGQYMGEVNNLQTSANTAIEKLVTGKSKNIHETMLAVEKAEIAF